LITVKVPPGRHEVALRFGTTVPRVVSWFIAAGSLLFGLVLVLRIEQRAVDPVWTTGNPLVSPMPRISYLVHSLAAVVLIGGGLLPRLMPESFSVRSPRGFVLSAQYPLPRALQGGIDLLAYDLELRRLGSDTVLDLTLYWRAFRPDLPDYQVDLLLVPAVDPGGAIRIAQHRHPGMIPSSQWPSWPLLDSYVRDSYSIVLDETISAGDYQVAVQVGRCSQLNLLPCETTDLLFVGDGRGRSLGQQILLPTAIEIKR
jgi:hypothetical protein